MARFLTRLANSVTRVVLVAPCLLTCSCATSFPLDELEVGMTMEQTIEAFGEPSSRGLDECWTRRAADPPSVVWRRCEAVGQSETLGPVAVMSTWVYRSQVDLRFQGNKLVRWKVIRPTPPAVSSGSNWDTDEMQWDRDKDAAHHEAEKKDKDAAHHEAEGKALKKHQKKEKKLLTEHQKEEGTSKAHSKAEKKALKKHQKEERRRLEKHQHSP